ALPIYASPTLERAIPGAERAPQGPQRAPDDPSGARGGPRTLWSVSEPRDGLATERCPSAGSHLVTRPVGPNEPVLAVARPCSLAAARVQGRRRPRANLPRPRAARAASGAPRTLPVPRSAAARASTGLGEVDRPQAAQPPRTSGCPRRTTPPSAGATLAAQPPRTGGCPRRTTPPSAGATLAAQPPRTGGCPRRRTLSRARGNGRRKVGPVGKPGFTGNNRLSTSEQTFSRTSAQGRLLSVGKSPKGDARVRPR